MKVGEITAALEVFAPLRIQEKWDNSGLIIGSADDEVHGVMVGFDCTPDLIREAVEKGCDMVVTHHPLIFNGIKRIDSKDPVGAAIMQAVRSGVAVYAAHTTADKVIAGVSGAMARRLFKRLLPASSKTTSEGWPWVIISTDADSVSSQCRISSYVTTIPDSGNYNVLIDDGSHTLAQVVDYIHDHSDQNRLSFHIYAASHGVIISPKMS